MTMEYCPACHRAGEPEVVLKACGSFLTCRKKMEPIDPEQHVVISCEPCGKTVVMGTYELMASKVTKFGNNCARGPETCQAKIIHPEVSYPATEALPPNEPLTVIKKSPTKRSAAKDSTGG